MRVKITGFGHFIFSIAKNIQLLLNILLKYGHGYVFSFIFIVLQTSSSVFRISIFIILHFHEIPILLEAVQYSC